MLPRDDRSERTDSAVAPVAVYESAQFECTCFERTAVEGGIFDAQVGLDTWNLIRGQGRRTVSKRVFVSCNAEDDMGFGYWDLCFAGTAS